MGIFRRLRRAVDASLSTLGPGRYRARGEDVRCPVCDGDEFMRAAGGPCAKPFLRAFNAPWLKLDSHATSLICTHCAHILTFGRAPEAVDER